MANKLSYGVLQNLRLKKEERKNNIVSKNTFKIFFFNFWLNLISVFLIHKLPLVNKINKHKIIEKNQFYVYKNGLNVKVV